MCLQHWSWGHLLNGKILLSWVFIILGGSAQGGRRRRGEWVGGRVGGCGVARAGRSLWAKSLSGRGPSALLSACISPSAQLTLSKEFNVAHKSLSPST